MAETSLEFDIFARDRASRVFNTVGRSAQNLERESSKAGGMFSSLGGKVLEFGKTAAIGAGLATVSAIGMGIKTAASLEQMQVAFSTLLGSGQKAQAFLAQLKNFAAKTPFELPGVVDAARQLLGVGASAKSVIPTLTAWGDTAGALGLSQDQFSRTMIALTQSMANGKIQAGDMLQITQAGIPIWSLMAKALGVPVAKVREMSEQGKLLTKDVLPKLEQQMEKDYGGAMAKQSQTLTGVWSTFMDTLKLGLAQAVQPLLPVLKTAIPAAANILGVALKGLAKGFQYLMQGAKLVGQWLGPHLKTSSKEGTSVLTDFKKLVSLVFTDVRDWFNNNKDTVAKWGETIGQIAKTALGIIDGVLKILIALWQRFGKNFITLVTGLFGDGLKGLLGALLQIKGIIDIVLGLLTGDWRRVFKGMDEYLKGTVMAFKATVHAGFTYIRTAISNALNVARSVFGGAFSAMRSAASSAVSAVTSRVSTMLSKIRSVASGIKRAFSSAGSWLYNAGRNIISGLISGVTARLGSLWSVFSNITSHIPKIKGPPERDRRLLVPAGNAIMGGLIASITGSIPALDSALGNVTAAIASPPMSPNPGLVRAAGGASGGRTGTMQLEWVGGNATDEFLRWLRKNIRAVAGSGPNSVQKALGGKA